MAMVICYYCGEKVDRNKIPFYKVNGNRYAHAECHKEHEDMSFADKEKLKDLEDYIKKIFNVKTLSAKIRSQIKQFTNTNSYTYQGILNALKYSLEVKHNSIEKMNGGIGIVPYIYEESLVYYEKINSKIKLNKEKNIKEFIPKEKKVKILNPKRKIKKNDGFDFLD